MPYYLDNAFLLDNPWITVVGCGGTGGFVAEGLCRLFQGREATIVLVDHDRVEPHNLLRQNFYPEDVGKFKSQALADRLARAYRRRVGYSVYPSGRRTPAPMGAATPAFPPTGTPCSSAAPTTPPLGGPWQSACRATPAGGSSTRATTPTGGRCWSVTSQARSPGTSQRSGRDLLPAARTHAAAPRPADGGVHRASRRGLRCCPRTSPTRTRPSTR